MLAPIVPPAPVRLSTTSCCPSSSLIFVATIRVIVSIEEPGVWATMTRTGRSGYLAADWAAAGSDAAARLSTEKASNALCMTDLLREVLSVIRGCGDLAALRCVLLEPRLPGEVPPATPG